MHTAKRTTVYLEPVIHKTLRIKAAETDKSMSEMVNEALKLALLEDIEDLNALKKARHEQGTPFEKVLEELKRDGLL